MKIENRTELKEYRIECQKKQSADCRVLVCGGTGCLASGSGKIYEKLKEAGIENKDIPTAVINIASKGNLKGILESENYIEQIQTYIEEITQGLSIEQVERYLGYYDVKGTGIELRDYQQDAVNKADEIYKEKTLKII